MNKKINKKCVIILSGGMDSVTLLYDLVKKGYDVEALSFNYGSNHNNKELPLAKWHCEQLNIKHKIISIPLKSLFDSSLLGSEEIPEGHYEDENMKSTVVPFRNGIMLSFAVGYAENINAKYVMIGSHAGDHAIYPDCRKDFTETFSKAASLGTYNNIEVKSLYSEIMKWDIVTRGLELNVPYEKTWSCYKGQDKHCGKCGTCVERLEAFEKNNVKDPVEYE